jgi:EpsI family protein
VSVAWSIAFPLVFLLFMVPAGEAFNPPLMEATADATIWAIRASGIPVFREGLHFTLPTGRWSVVEACSGLRYVLASAMLASLFAYLNFRKFYKQVVFVGTALCVAILANWIRAYLIVMLGHFSGMTLGVGDDHVVYGWIFFGLVMFAVFWMGARWRDDDGVPGDGTASARTGQSAQPVRRSSSGAGLASMSVIVAAALAVVSLAWFGLRELRDVEPRTDLAIRAAAAIGPFGTEPLGMQPRFTGARGVVQGVLDPALGTDFYVAYFARQSDGNEIIAFGNTVLSDSDKTWATMSRTQRSIDVGGRPLPITEWSIRAGSAHRLVWSWYTVGGAHANSDYRAKGLTALKMLVGAGDHSTIAVVATALDQSVDLRDSAGLEAARARLAKAAVGARRLGEAMTSR